MRYSKEHKRQTRQRILRSAGRLFAAKGFDGASIDEIMHDCDLTRGGFYAHFRSKSQLYRDAMTLAASPRRTAPRDDWVNALLDEYIEASNEAFLASDAASRDPEVRSAYAKAIETMTADLASRVAARYSCGEHTVLAIAAMIVGVLAIVQTVDDTALKSKLLAACKANTKALLEGAASEPLSFFWEPPVRIDRRRA